ncbi:MAG: transcriptional repressor [Myxococcota bacterium]
MTEQATVRAVELVQEESKQEARRTALKAHGLRVTHPRLEVLRVLEDADGPLSYTDVVQALGEANWDRATTFRNLIRLVEAGVAVVASRAKGIDRYALAETHKPEHSHAHFLCDTCGKVACLPAEITESLKLTGKWAASVRAAKVQLRGPCPDCIEGQEPSGDN